MANLTVNPTHWVRNLSATGLLSTRLSLSFESPVALFSTPVANSLLCGWILSTTGNFTRSIKGKSSILSCNRCYGLRPLMTALYLLKKIERRSEMSLTHTTRKWHKNQVTSDTCYAWVHSMLRVNMSIGVKTNYTCLIYVTGDNFNVTAASKLNDSPAYARRSSLVPFPQSPLVSFIRRGNIFRWHDDIRCSPLTDLLKQAQQTVDCAVAKLQFLVLNEMLYRGHPLT